MAAPDSHDTDPHTFGLHNLPYGSFHTADDLQVRVGVAVHDFVLDLTGYSRAAGFPRTALFAHGNLDALLAAGPATWAEVRAWLTQAVRAGFADGSLRPHLIPMTQVSMRLPFAVGDFVDFYSSLHHAINGSRIFRPSQPAVQPNWKHLPVGYHGRASSVIVSGTPVRRPCGQRMSGDGQPEFAASARLDIEAEVAFVVGTPSELGSPVPLADFENHVFGACLLNDWSARDLQQWESAPLGPFTGKSFATSISPWIVPLAALGPARVAPPPRDVPLQPYLDDAAYPWALDIALEIRLNGTVVSTPQFSRMYWTAAQQLAHLTVSGAALRSGDLYASGTVSGPERAEFGSLLELSWNGTAPLVLPDGSTRTYLEDGDEVVIRGVAAPTSEQPISFGDVRGIVTPALDAD